MTDQQDLDAAKLILARDCAGGEPSRFFEFEDSSGTRFCVIVGRGECAREMSRVWHQGMNPSTSLRAGGNGNGAVAKSEASR